MRMELPPELMEFVKSAALKEKKRARDDSMKVPPDRRAVIDLIEYVKLAMTPRDFVVGDFVELRDNTTYNIPTRRNPALVVHIEDWDVARAMEVPRQGDLALHENVLAAVPLHGDDGDIAGIGFMRFDERLLRKCEEANALRDEYARDLQEG